MRFLVVDDDPAIRFFVREALLDEGHEVTAARDGREALTIVEERQPDVIFLDM